MIENPIENQIKSIIITSFQIKTLKETLKFQDILRN